MTTGILYHILSRPSANLTDCSEAMSTSNKVAELKEFNILVDIKKSDKIRISKFSGADKLDRYISGLEVVEK